MGRKRDQVDVDREQHQLDRHQDDDDVLAVQEDAEDPEREQDRGDRQIMGQADLEHGFRFRSPLGWTFLDLDGIFAPATETCSPIFCGARRRAAAGSGRWRRSWRPAAPAPPPGTGRCIWCRAPRRGLGVGIGDLIGRRDRRRQSHLRRHHPGPARTTINNSASRTIPTSAPIGRYCRKPWRSSTKLMSSIMTTNRNSTATAPT